MSKSVALLKAVRQTHLYLGVFVGPALLFFAITGAIQTFSLHEITKGSNYRPPHILVVLAKIHKKQTPVVAPAPPVKDPAPGFAKPAPETLGAPAPHNSLPLKIFFLLASISLAASTFSGLYMSYKYSRNKTVITTMLVLGTVIPVVMILI